jgi:crossover junction endodeoxyribonuclease RuvC
VTGYGVIDSDGVRSRHVASGCVRTTTGAEFTVRLGEIFHGIRSVLLLWQPQQVAVEQVFVAANPAAALKLGQARGAAISAAVTCDLQIFEVTPTEVKKGLVGTGRAEKQQVQHMVGLLLGVRNKMTLDESDALAIALCHAHRQATRSRFERGRA